MITKPILAGKAPADLSQLRFPGACTPKLDGIRCIKLDGKAKSRTFKPIPNEHIREAIERDCPDGVDGELVTYYRDEKQERKLKAFNDLSGDIRRSDGKPDFGYMVFDYVKDGNTAAPYAERIAHLAKLKLPDFCEKIIPVKITTLEELTEYEVACLAEGHEGVMWRAVDGQYKCGRSSTNEGYLLKLKRFEDAEAEVIGYEELYENQNVAEKDNFGRSKRASNKENLVPRNTLGALLCRLPSGIEFGIGTGFSQADRAELWADRAALIGRQVKFKSQSSGADVRPRFPVWLGMRAEVDTE